MASGALSGKTAAITGGGSGIGAAIARALAAEGAKVILLGRRREPLEAVAGETGGSALVCDVTDGSAISAVTGELAKADILVNNAGGVSTAPFDKTSPQELRRLLELNLVSAWAMTQAVLPGMRERGWGRIVNVASTAALKGYPYVSAYVAAKHGLLGMTRALALELAKTGITVNALCPGYSDTDLIGDAAAKVAEKTGKSIEAIKQDFAAGNPQGRLIQPEEVASAALWLTGAGSGAITGQAVAIAGGEVM
ncbi:MAG: SDR family NAD(P)-dependent oxidoreductase [Rhodovibrionaceae bacterium]